MVPGPPPSIVWIAFLRGQPTIVAALAELLEAARVLGRARVLAADMGAKVSEMADRPKRPDHSHARGAFRSRFLPQDRSHFDASAWVTALPCSSSSRPA